MRSIKLYSLIIIIWILPKIVLAGPTIISDDRIKDLGSTPALGRGYSISTNTFQSICFKNIKLTEPSYDFTYRFTSAEKITEGNLEEYFERKTFSKEFRFEILKKLVDFYKNRDKKAEFYTHKIVVVINLNSYYSSLNESSAELSRSAGVLLQRDDIPGFFSSCGSYYARSIVRNAKFVAIFSYRTRLPEKDVEYEKKVEAQISGFAKSSSRTKNIMNAADLFVDYAFRKESEQKNLIIDFSAFGLGKNKKSSLISYDIDTFRQALKDAFLSMQNPQTGKVISVELVPWVENTEFQALVRLEERTQDGEKLLLYEKKQILNKNGEFLAELERINRRILDVYYKAKLCRDYIDNNWKTSSFGGLILKYKDRKVMNLKGGDPYRLSELDKFLSQDLLDNILKEENLFMYGHTGKTGARACMKNILQKGIFRVPYVELKECKDILKNYTIPDYKLIEDYCMPHLIKEDRQ